LSGSPSLCIGSPCAGDLRPQPGAADGRKFAALDRAERAAAQIRAALTVRSCRRPIGYVIIVGVAVSIARTDEAPEVFGNPLLAAVG
jgi:hypothetical protein